jgi:hypothetical protein
MGRLAAFVALAVSLGAVPAASAQVIERVRVADAGAPLTKGFPRNVFVGLASPPAYQRGSSSGTAGTWVGPRYEAEGLPGGQSSMSWQLRFVPAKDAASAAAGIPTHGWPVDLKGGVSVPHVIGRRIVGTILGAYVLTRAPGDTSAAYDAGLAFPVGPKLYALADFAIVQPPSADAGAGKTYLVNGVAASFWNRGQALRALTGARVEGSLPPTRVSAAARGRVVTGTVADAFRHPVVGARVSLQRLVGSSWRAIASTKTDGRGDYVIRGISRRGRYRVVASVGGAAARSVDIRAGA